MLKIPTLPRQALCKCCMRQHVGGGSNVHSESKKSITGKPMSWSPSPHFHFFPSEGAIQPRDFDRRSPPSYRWRGEGRSGSSKTSNLFTCYYTRYIVHAKSFPSREGPRNNDRSIFFISCVQLAPPPPLTALSLLDWKRSHFTRRMPMRCHPRSSRSQLRRTGRRASSSFCSPHSP